MNTNPKSKNPKKMKHFKIRNCLLPVLVHTFLVHTLRCEQEQEVNNKYCKNIFRFKIPDIIIF